MYLPGQEYALLWTHSHIPAMGLRYNVRCHHSIPDIDLEIGRFDVETSQRKTWSRGCKLTFSLLLYEILGAGSDCKTCQLELNRDFNLLTVVLATLMLQQAWLIWVQGRRLVWWFNSIEETPL